LRGQRFPGWCDYFVAFYLQLTAAEESSTSAGKGTALIARTVPN